MKASGAGLAAIVTLASAGSGLCHEFWIEALDYTVPEGGRIVAELKVGQRFEGTSYAYIPASFRRFDIASGGSAEPVAGRIGDRPALDVEAPAEGLASLIHVTRDYALDWSSWEEFVSFLKHKDAEWVVEAHARRGLGEAVSEGYSRHAKALVAVGDGAGEDRRYGLVTEIVALENPYVGETGDGLDVQVFYGDAPRADAQVEVFRRDREGVDVSTVRTDAEGVATIPVVPGASYLLDAVVLREPGAEMARTMPSAQWESLWASLTFAVPE